MATQSSSMRLWNAGKRILRRYLGKGRKVFLTGKPRSAILARVRQRSSEKFFSEEFSRLIEPSLCQNNNQPNIRLAFIHVPKCGGTSLHFWLRDELGLVKLNSVPLMKAALSSRPFPEVVSFGHLSVDSVIENRILSNSSLENAFTFSITRNPFTRVLSLYSHFQQIGQLAPDWGLNRFLRLVRKSNGDVGLFNLARFSQAAPQSRWICQSSWSGPKLIVPLEDLSPLNAVLATDFGVSSPMRPLRDSKSDRFIEQWNDDTTRIAQDIYQEDFENFGYSPALLPFEVQT